MSEQLKNSKLANQIYLLVNVLNTGFMVYLIARSFNVMDLMRLTQGVYIVVLIGFIMLVNGLSSYAKRNGGIGNPIRSNKRARAFHIAAVIFFIAGLLLVSFANLPRVFMLLALLGFPLDMYAIYKAYNEVEVIDDETDLIDDFKIDEN